MTAAGMPVPGSAPFERLRAIDVVRGLACALMAIDHVRVYAGIPAGGPEPAIFLTRWVTHFVAPAFCFFAGTGAFLLYKRLGDAAALRRFLITRGLLLVVLELTLIRFLWGFHIGADFLLAGVIWMLGWCMVLLGCVVGARPYVIGWTGVGIVALQSLFGFVPRAIDAIAPFWAFIYNSPADAPFGINVLYVVVPWVGVMMAGFGFGLLLERAGAERDRLLWRLGVGLTLAWFVAASAYQLYTGDLSIPDDGSPRPLWMRVLDQRKYPASQFFLLMTLGPAIAVLPLAERWRGWIGRMLEMFGRVPMWYYLMHLLVIHTAAIITNGIRLGTWTNAWFTTAPYTRIPPEGRWSLWLLYLVWAICLAILFSLCRWYGERKRRAPSKWMSYL